MVETFLIIFFFLLLTLLISVFISYVKSHTIIIIISLIYMDSLQGFETSNSNSSSATILTPGFPENLSIATASTTVNTTITITANTNENPLPAVPAAASSSSSSASASPSTLSRYENQKRRDWNTFGQYLRNHRPPLSLSRCSGAHVLEFLRYLDQFGKTKVHTQLCPFFGHPHPPAPCPCPLRQAWGSLDALIGRLRAAFEEHGGKPEANPFGARAVRLYLREVRDSQSKARGISYEKKKRKRPPQAAAPLPPPPNQNQ